MILVALILNIVGFLCLAAAGVRYREALLGRGRHLSRPARIRVAGAFLLAASWFSLSQRVGFGSVVVTFAGLSTVGAAFSVMCVTLGRHLRSR
ncbi:DUF3325 family protein [Sphingomonas oryzagri]|jgi:hypothetical protein|uniref:DUF3325 family protein n=1 Tax=Sphingomonas oryzagri TaxID=3042314 RepID=A0ABT6MZ52_9SPHN|nr:DUF3325 family protein [Sphingomonas oryzagri]MDH7638334.1 DUF3325 family protein [Sphingomonas oryzagri]